MKRTKLGAAVIILGLALGAVTMAYAGTIWHVATNGVNAVGRGTSWDDNEAEINMKNRLRHDCRVMRVYEKIN